MGSQGVSTIMLIWYGEDLGGLPNNNNNVNPKTIIIITLMITCSHEKE